MTSTSEKLKLEMVETISHLEDDGIIVDLHGVIGEILNTPRPTQFERSPAFFEAVDRGLKQLEDGEVGSWKEVDAAFEDGIKEGLRLRELDGKSRD